MGRGRKKIRSQHDDNATVDSLTAVVEGTRNDLKSSELFRHIRKLSPFVPTADAVKEEGGDEEGGDEDDSKRGRARVFDARRIAIVVVALAVIISVAVISSSGFAKPPPSFSTSTSTAPHPTEDGLPHLHKYAYVFVAYEKSGYAVAHQFYDQLQKSIEERDKEKGLAGGRLRGQFIDPRSEFNAESNCTDLNLEKNTITILEMPEFHCSMPKLRSLFMDHEDLEQDKWGVKLIHLVRNPFTMAVANYRDRRSYLMPEEVRFKNPCVGVTQDFAMTVADLNSPILSEKGIMTREDFEGILARCVDTFQTQPGLEIASYQQHLEQLPPADGLRLAAADGLNGIALMASNLIAFERVRALVQAEADTKRRQLRYLDMMTVPLDEVLSYPGNSMIDFLDFIFGSHMSAYSKRRAAAEYERNRIGEDPIGAAEMEEMIGFLKNDPLLYGPLTRVESLLDSVLAEQEEAETEAKTDGQ